MSMAVTMGKGYVAYQVLKLVKPNTEVCVCETVQAGKSSYVRLAMLCPGHDMI